jgi:predicted AlkP superfamily phosphohydrolase/phosphomutase
MLVREEVHGPQRISDLLTLGDDLVEATRRVTSASLDFMRREPWDLFFVSFGASHRGGHKLWDETAVRGAAGEEEIGAIRASFRKIYAALDEAVGALVPAAGVGTAAVVFSLHGMGPNRNRAVVLPEMLRRVLAGSRTGSAGPAPERGLSRLRGSVPPEVRSGVKGRLPVALRDRLTAFWVEAAGARRPASAFPLPADLHGYVRMNLIGRDPKGVVPASSVEALSEEIREGLMTFRDARSGEAVVQDVIRLEQALGAGERLHRLPDLIVRWSDAPSARHEALVSERLGTIPWPITGRNPDGRSGNHREEGFLLAAGEGIPDGGRIEGGTILDLAPTVLALLGAPRPFLMEGKPLAPIAPDG